MSSETKLDAEQICYGGAHRIGGFLYPLERCALIKDESKSYFVFKFKKWDPSYPLWGWQEIGRFTVLGAMIEDRIMSKRRLNAALWHTLGQIRGMV